MGRLVEQAAGLVAAGFAELVLTGVDIASYGADLPGRPNLGRMVRRLLVQLPDLQRLRLSSLDPVAVDQDLLRLAADEPRLMPHFHLSAQAGDDLVLKRMKRRHSRADLLAVAERLRRARPDAALGADIIAGFPTETDAMFDRTLSLVDEMGLSHLHVFPFSPRPGTPAARMPQIAGAVVRERAARLRARGAAGMTAFLEARIGHDAAVLVERPGYGHSEHYLPVRLEGGAPVGTILKARVRGMADGHLLAVGG
jgi:threonylcarbamoyladenosine tRNA methylthiotransferase MtaB